MGCCLLGEGMMPSRYTSNSWGSRSGNTTFGHRAKSHKPIPVSGINDYTKKLQQAM